MIFKKIKFEYEKPDAKASERFIGFECMDGLLEIVLYGSWRKVFVLKNMDRLEFTDITNSSEDSQNLFIVAKQILRAYSKGYDLDISLIYSKAEFCDSKVYLDLMRKSTRCVNIRK